MQWGYGLISLPFLSVVSLTVQISKAWATPRLVSLKGLILIFQQAFPFPYVPFIRESPPPPRPEKKTGGYIIRGKPSVPFCGFVTSGSHETSVMRDQHHALRAINGLIRALPFTLFALVQDLHAMAVRKVALPVDESAHSEQACDCKY